MGKSRLKRTNTQGVRGKIEDIRNWDADDLVDVLTQPVSLEWFIAVLSPTSPFNPIVQAAVYEDEKLNLEMLLTNLSAQRTFQEKMERDAESLNLSRQQSHDQDVMTKTNSEKRGETEKLSGGYVGVQEEAQVRPDLFSLAYKTVESIEKRQEELEQLLQGLTQKFEVINKDWIHTRQEFADDYISQLKKLNPDLTPAQERALTQAGSSVSFAEKLQLSPELAGYLNFLVSEEIAVDEAKKVTNPSAHEKPRIPVTLKAAVVKMNFIDEIGKAFSLVDDSRAEESSSMAILRAIREFKLSKIVAPVEQKIEKAAELMQDVLENLKDTAKYIDEQRKLKVHLFEVQHTKTEQKTPEQDHSSKPLGKSS